jgi:hypothetical protein
VALAAICLWPRSGLASEPAAPPDQKEAATTVVQCVSAHAKAQEYRRSHLLLEARNALKECTRPECPALVLKDCDPWIDEVEKETPSVVFQITSQTAQLTDPAVTVDGEPVELSSGAPLRLDPGRHSYRVEHGGYKPEIKEFIVFEGQRFRVLNVELVPLVSAQASKPLVEPPAPRAPAVEPYRPVPTLTYALGAVGVVGMIGFATFGILGQSKQSNLEQTCSPSCKDDDLNPVRMRYLAADISLGIGAAGLAASALTYLLRPEKPRSVVVSLVPGPSGIFGSLVVKGM